MHDFVAAPHPGVETCELDGERLVWSGGVLHRLDSIGAVVWKCFDGKTTVSALARTLAQAFSASERDIERDVAALCEELLEEGLLEGGRPKTLEPPPALRLSRPPSVPLDESVQMPHTTGRFCAFDHDFGFRSEDPRLVAHFDRSLRSFAAAGSPARWYSVVSTTETDERYRMYLDGEGLFVARDADAVVRYLLWHVNHEVIKRASSHLLIHAAGATISGKAVVFPGQMNAGKTTLVAGLVMEGPKFLTDELVALNLNTGLVDPYPRPMNIGSGSWEVLARLRPDGRDEGDPLPRDLWHVDPTSIRPDAVAEPAPIRWIIAPRFEDGTQTRLEPLSRAGAVELLHHHAFNKHRFGDMGVRKLITAVSQARCCSLINGDLRAAVATVREFVEQDADL
jgi:hypothetical protein